MNFPASETANFANGVNGYIDIYFYNDEVKTVNNFALFWIVLVPVTLKVKWFELSSKEWKQQKSSVFH